jgi:SDR family mycofactocin-dependent oxidoreductase
MSGRFEGQVVLISGVARGQGRSHAIHFAREGARIVGFDICHDLPSSSFALASESDLDETRAQIEKAGAEIVALQGDVRSMADIRGVVQAGVEAFGQIDVVVANAGIVGPVGPSWELDEASVVDVIDIDLIGIWRTVSAAVPELLKRPGGGSVVMTSSGAGVKGLPNIGAYVAAKHGVIGLMRAMARELAPKQIRVNAVLPGNCDTPMLQSVAIKRLYVPDEEAPTREQFAAAARTTPMGIPWVDPADVSEAVMWLCSQEARYVTGIALPVDGGSGIP